MKGNVTLTNSSNSVSEFFGRGFPFLVKFIKRLAGVSFPKIIIVSALPAGGIDPGKHVVVLVVVLDDIIQEIRGDAITGIVTKRSISPPTQPNNISAMALRLVLEPADVIRNAFDEPAGGADARSVGIVAATAILLKHMNFLVQQCAKGFAIEFALEPVRICCDARPASRGHARAWLDRNRKSFGWSEPFAG